MVYEYGFSVNLTIFQIRFKYWGYTMATLMPMEAPRAGFNFENCKRNALLANNGYQPPKVIKELVFLFTSTKK